METPELHVLLERVRSGDDEAARQLLEHFEPHVRRVVRRRLPVMLRSKFDSLDFVQSVWGDFFSKLGRNEISFESPHQLAKFLAVVAQSKVANEFRRRLGTQKLDVRREIAIGSREQFMAGATPDPTPSQTVAAQEELEAVLSDRPHTHREVVRMRREGFTFAEIAEKNGIDERTARRIMRSVEKDLGLDNAG